MQVLPLISEMQNPMEHSLTFRRHSTTICNFYYHAGKILVLFINMVNLNIEAGGSDEGNTTFASPFVPQNSVFYIIKKLINLFFFYQNTSQKYSTFDGAAELQDHPH